MTPAVELREVRESDLPILYENQADPVACAMAAFPSRDRDAFNAHWARILTDETVLARIILFGGEVAGTVNGFHRDGRRYVGYWLGRAYWGKGIATQAVAALLEIELTRPLWAHVVKHNVASRRVLEKCGFVVCREEVNSKDGVEELVLRLD